MQLAKPDPVLCQAATNPLPSLVTRWMLATRRTFLFLALLTVSLNGCGMDPQLIKDVEATYQANGGSKPDVSTAVQKHFPPGVKVSEALKQLEELGFEITEFRQEGFRKLPSGELWKYQDEAHRKAALSGNKFTYSAQKYYDHHLMLRLLRKRGVVAFSSDGEQIFGVRGYVYIDGI